MRADLRGGRSSDVRDRLSRAQSERQLFGTWRAMRQYDERPKRGQKPAKPNGCRLAPHPYTYRLLIISPFFFCFHAARTTAVTSYRPYVLCIFAAREQKVWYNSATDNGRRSCSGWRMSSGIYFSEKYSLADSHTRACSTFVDSAAVTQSKWG
jgi:hypothetical protein